MYTYINIWKTQTIVDYESKVLMSYMRWFSMILKYYPERSLNFHVSTCKLGIVKMPNIAYLRENFMKLCWMLGEMKQRDIRKNHFQCVLVCNIYLMIPFRNPQRIPFQSFSLWSLWIVLKGVQTRRKGSAGNT